MRQLHTFPAQPVRLLLLQQKLDPVAVADREGAEVGKAPGGGWDVIAPAPNVRGIQERLRIPGYAKQRPRCPTTVEAATCGVLRQSAARGGSGRAERGEDLAGGPVPVSTQH